MRAAAFASLSSSTGSVAVRSAAPNANPASHEQRADVDRCKGEAPLEREAEVPKEVTPLVNADCRALLLPRVVCWLDGASRRARASRCYVTGFRSLDGQSDRRLPRRPDSLFAAGRTASGRLAARAKTKREPSKKHWGVQHKEPSEPGERPAPVV